MLLNTDISGDFWDALGETAFLDCVALFGFSKDYIDVLRTLLPAVCVIFRAGDEQNIAGQLLATFRKSEFVSSLQSYCDCDAADLLYVLLHFHVHLPDQRGFPLPSTCSVSARRNSQISFPKCRVSTSTLLRFLPYFF